jgi:hypothetical protein
MKTDPSGCTARHDSYLLSLRLLTLPNFHGDFDAFGSISPTRGSDKTITPRYIHENSEQYVIH